ncbi:MAG: general secretion pathway protein GspK, partial [Pirellulaceae bacterium]
MMADVSYCRLFRRHAAGGARRGMALILVLIIVAMVSLAGFSFVATMYNEEKATRLRGDEIQANQLARSAVVMIRTVVTQPADALQNAGGIYDNPDWFRGVLVYEDKANQQRGRFSVIAPRFSKGEPAGFRFGLENESAKLHLGALLAWDKQTPGTASESLAQLPGMTDSIADAVLDWIDTDGAARTFGAESDFYQTLDHPYAPRNATVECLEELLLIRGVSRQRLFGWDTNRNYYLDPDEAARAERADETASFESIESSVPWTSLLTVYSAERNVDPEGQPRIHLNDKDLSELHQRLRKAFGSPLADFVIAYRQHGPYQGQLEANTPPETVLDLSLRSRATFASPLDLVNARVRIRGGSTRPVPVLASPLNDRNPGFDDKILELLDYVTVDPEPVVRGRINVNLALPQVLSAVPNMDPAAVRQIQVERESQSGRPDPRRRHPVWLLLEGVVDLPRMKALMPYLTCGGGVYRAQVVGYFDGPGPTSRAEVVIDTTQQTARQLYWKDLRILGRGYSRETLGGDSD